MKMAYNTEELQKLFHYSRQTITRMEKDGRLHRLYGLPGVWYRASDVRELCEFEEPAHSDDEWEAVTGELLRLKDEVAELRRRLENVQIAACGGESK